MAWRFSWLKRHRPCLTGLELGLMLMVCSVTSRETPDISSGLHTKMSLLHRRKSTSSPSYLGLKPAPIWTVWVGSSTSICTALASSATLKVSNEEGMVRPIEKGGLLRHSSLSSVVATVATASSILFCSQSNAR
jgi:hypothetical protein